MNDGLDAGEHDNVVSLVSRLVGETRELAGAEVELAKARIGERVAAYQGAAIFFAAAGVIALAALIALLTGLILTLATLVGPGFATAIVVIAALALAAVLGLVGKSRLKPADLEMER